MKKILLGFSVYVFCTLTSNLNAQTTVLPDGIQSSTITCALSNDPGPTACPKICKNSGVFTNLGGGQFKFKFVFYKHGNGNKGIYVNIQCGITLVVNSCIDLSSLPDGVQYYKEFTFPCSSLTAVTVSLTPYTGNSCGGGSCAPTLVSVGGGPLPVNLTTFTAARKHSNVLLKWETASELNNTGFAVERNTNGTWQQVGFVASQAQGGNSSELLSYQFIDPNDTKGMSQYRIKQIDFDSKSTYSEIRSVRGDGQIGGVIVYPNPTTDGKVNVSFDASAIRDVSLIDMSGRMLKQWKGVTNNNLQIDNLQPGMYTLRVVVPETGDQTVTKVVVNKR